MISEPKWLKQHLDEWLWRHGHDIPDMLDPDADGDGIFNTWEYQMDPMTDPFNATILYDKDGIPDIFSGMDSRYKTPGVYIHYKL